MKTCKRLKRLSKKSKRFYKKLKDHSLTISLITTIITGIIVPLYLYHVQKVQSEYEFQVERSFWDTVCRAWGDDEAHPTRNEHLNRYVIEFEKALGLPINVTFGCTVKVKKGNST